MFVLARNARVAPFFGPPQRSPGVAVGAGGLPLPRLRVSAPGLARDGPEGFLGVLRQDEVVPAQLRSAERQPEVKNLPFSCRFPSQVSQRVFTSVRYVTLSRQREGS